MAEKGEESNMFQQNGSKDLHNTFPLPAFTEDLIIDTKRQAKRERRVSGSDVKAKLRLVSNIKPSSKRQSIEKGECSFKICDDSSDELVDKKRKLPLNREVVLRQTLVKFESICNSLSGGPDAVHIHRLPNELLDRIFSYLDITQRMNLELVCKRWRLVGKVVTWSEPKRLIFDPWNRRDNPAKGKWILSNDILEAILSRCGRSLRQISIVKLYRPKCNPRYHVSVTEDSMKTIAAHCPNLEILKLKHLRLNRTRLLCLARGCQKLKSVHFSMFGSSDVDFSAFYRTCKSLESLTLEPYRKKIQQCDLHEDAVLGEGFNCLSPNLWVLNLKKCDNICSSSLKNLVTACHSIRELRLAFKYPEKVNSYLVMEVLQHYKNSLKVLDLHLPFKPFNWCKALKVLRNLEELYLHMQGIVLDCPCYEKNDCFSKVSPKLRVLSAVETSMLNSCNEDYILTKIFMSCDTLEQLCLPLSHVLPSTLKLTFKYADILKNLDLCRYLSKNCKWCQFFPELPSLVELKLTHAREIDDDLANVLAKNCLQLKALHLASTSITDEGLLHLASLPSLTELDVSDCEGITDIGVELLAAHGRIQVLHLATTSKLVDVTNDGCRSLAIFCPRLRFLDVSNTKGTTKITDDFVAVFRESVQNGFLAPGVELIVGGTSVRRHVETCRGLEVCFANYHSLTAWKVPLDEMF